MKKHKMLFSLLLVLCLLLGVSGSAFAASYTGYDIYPGLSGIQPGDELTHPENTDWATLTASWGVRVTFVDWNGTELKTELVPVTDSTPGSSSAPEDPIRFRYTFTGWERYDTTSGTATLNDDGTVTGINGPGPIVFIATYTKNTPSPKPPVVPKTGSLTVSKTVSGNAADSTEAFSFTVTLADESINGTYGGMTFTNGVATFTLKDGERKTAKGLPAKTSYTVTEEDYSADGYVTTKSGETGTIARGKIATAAFINTKNTITPPTPPVDPKTGDLTIRKSFAGLEPTDKLIESIYYILTVEGREGEDVLYLKDFDCKDGVYSITIPASVGKYSIEERGAEVEGYNLTCKMLEAFEVTESGYTLALENSYTKNITPPIPPADPKVGKLTISKNVTGDLGDKTEYFTFKVEFNVDGTFKYSGSKSGAITSGGTIQLKHGESITIEEIPAGTSYTVTEIGNSGYIVSASGDKGTISDGKTSTAEFTNTRSSVPKTGDNSNMPLWFSLMGASVLGIIGTLFIKTNKRKKAADLSNK